MPAENVLGKGLKGRLVLPLQVMPERTSDPLGGLLPNGLPTVLVFSEAARMEYDSDEFQGWRLKHQDILSDDSQIGFFLEVGGSDCLAIGKVDVDGVWIKLKNGEYVKFDPNKQRLGLKITTGEEARNHSQNFWAEQFIINLENEIVEAQANPAIAELIETRIWLEPIVGQVKTGLARFGLREEAQVSERFGLKLSVLRAKKYNFRTTELTDGYRLPILLVLDSRVTTEIVGDLSASEEVGGFIGARTHRLRVSRASQLGIKDRLIWCEVESDDRGLLTLKDVYKEPRYQVTDMDRIRTEDALVHCLALLCQRAEIHGEQKLKLTPFSVELTGEQALWLQRKRNLSSLRELEQNVAVVNQAAAGEEQVADLGENFPEEGFNLFKFVGSALGMDKQEWVKEGIVGGKHRALWMNKESRPVIRGSAWKAGYFDRGSHYLGISQNTEGKVVLTHIVAEINGVSRLGLADNRLESTSNAEDGVAVKIYVLPDQTIKVDIGGQVKELKESREKQFWQTVLAEMTVEEPERTLL